MVGGCVGRFGGEILGGGVVSTSDDGVACVGTPGQCWIARSLILISAWFFIKCGVYSIVFN